MSEAEVVTAFVDWNGIYHQVLFGYVSLMSGFLIMSYLAAHKLPVVLASIILAMFSIVSAGLIFRMTLVRNNMEALLEYVVEQKALGNYDLPWFPLQDPSIGMFSGDMEIFATVGSLVGCMVFFFYQRRLGQDASQTKQSDQPQ